MDNNLVTLVRGKPEDNDIAVVREAWVAEWEGYGYKRQEEPMAAPEQEKPKKG